ncbi:MAG: RNase adapter RapZ [Lachnospiraceae bacterium]|nr:RNase adapter RapZ [Lachnospiraceae bacterium]
MRFVIVTGMSGSGKSTAMKMLEDAGFYCVDNLPVRLVEKFMELLIQPGGELSKVALGLDARSEGGIGELEQILDRLKGNEYQAEVLFLDAGDETLIRRYKETRRIHPLSQGGRVEDGVRRERELFEAIKGKATYVIDTSNLLTREFKEELERIFVRGEDYNNLMITVLSFGFKYGIPTDADLVFDVRFLPNPFYFEEMRHQTGNDESVRNYVMQFEEAEVFLQKLEDMLQFLIPNYIKEGKYNLVIAVGCTGGRHRSVTLANALYERMKGKGDYGIKLLHRDITR